jgi:4-amino-4-deoxy-L-arabinose transferase-like glycosyltransferase
LSALPDQRPSRRGPGLDDVAVAVTLFGLALAIRWVGFHRSVIDWDESLYFLMAEAWRAGHLPYTVLWDNKPIGIYAIFAAFQTVFGDDIASMRLAAVTAVSATAFLLYRLYLAICAISPDGERTRLPALLAALLYLLASTRDGGMAANTELFIAPFVCAGLLLALSPGQRRGLAFLSGLCLGLAFIIKYVALFEFAAPALALIIWSARGTGMGERPVYFIAGAAAPLLACLGLYVAAGHGDLFVSASITSNLRRLDMPFSFSLARQAIYDHATAFLLPYGAAVFLPVPVARSLLGTSSSGAWRREGGIAAVLLLWIAGALIGTAAAKSFYPHYFLQPLPALCLTAVWVLGRVGVFRGTAGLAAGLALLTQPLSGAHDAIAETARPVQMTGPGIGWLRDGPARVAADLAPVIAGSPGTALYVVDYQPILYSLTSAPPPTRFAFPSFICKRFLASVAAIDPVAEFNAIAAKRPRFIIRSRDPHPDHVLDNDGVYAALKILLSSRYQLWKSYPDALVYRLRDGSG